MGLRSQLKMGIQVDHMKVPNDDNFIFYIYTLFCFGRLEIIELKDGQPQNSVAMHEI